tara:strand:+ start:279 stop:1295 length:1017 start_codon:yes stop_codon:yes gene_type:complete
MKQSDHKFPLVSIIIPVFNGEKTIRECLKGVLSSNYKSVEIIVVDDGSIDKTSEIVKNFGRVKLLTQTNSGSATAKNHGAKNAKGEFFYFLDSDVVVFEDTISKFVETANKFEVDMVVGAYSTRPMNDGFVHHYKALTDYVMYLPKKYRKEVRVNHLIGGGGEMFSKDSFLNLGGFNTTYKGASVEREELFIRFRHAGYRSAANPIIVTRHYFPSFKGLIKNYIFRIYQTVKLLSQTGKKATSFSYISLEKAIIAPLFAFLLVTTLLTAFLNLTPFLLSWICTILFFILSREFIEVCYQHHGLKRTILLIGFHLMVCNVIFVSGAISKLLVTVQLRYY